MRYTQGWHRIITAVMTLLLLAGIAAPAEAGAAETDARAPDPDGSVGSPGPPPVTDEVRELAGGSTTQADIERALDAYWTADRLAEARPAEEFPYVRDAVRQTRRLQREAADDPGRDERPDGPAETFEPTRPLVPSARDDAPIRIGAVTPNHAPHQPVARTNGRVFFTVPGGDAASCSAAVINSAGKSTVWTAGHCVHTGRGGNWVSNWIFIPAYEDGAEPYGRWYAKQLWAKDNWIDDSDGTSDMGVAIMWTRNGQRIVNALGGHGISWNHSKNQFVRAFGYPAEGAFDGQKLRYCYGDTSTRYRNAPSIDDIKLRCDMTRGSSGGPWLRNQSSWTGYGYLNGVNSRINRIVNPTWMYSPYFDDSAKSLFDKTKNLS